MNREYLRWYSRRLHRDMEMLLHNSFNRTRFKDKIMQPFKVLQRPLRV